MVDSNMPNNPNRNNAPAIIGVVILIILIAVFVLARKGNNQTSSQNSNTDQTLVVTPTPTEDMMSPTPSVSDTPLATTTPTSSTTPTTQAAVKTFTVSGQNFSFSPSEIRVKKGDKVKIVFQNKSGFHDFVLDAFNVHTDTINGGQSSSVEFTADKTGTFEYYCSVSNHRDMGMKGNLIVQ